jgi:hypothetical protein
MISNILIKYIVTDLLKEFLGNASLNMAIMQ